MSSAGGRPSWQAMVSVGTSIVPPGSRPPPAEPPNTPPATTTPQVTASLQDFVASLGETGRQGMTEPAPTAEAGSGADNVANPVLACPHGICEYLQCCWLLERPCRDHKVLQKLFANPPLVMWLGYIMICELVEHGGA